METTTLDDDFQLEFNMADVRFIMKGIGYYTKNPLPSLGTTANGDIIYYMEVWVQLRESAGLDGWTPLFATKLEVLSM